MTGPSNITGTFLTSSVRTSVLSPKNAYRMMYALFAMTFLTRAHNHNFRCSQLSRQSPAKRLSFDHVDAGKNLYRT